MARRKAKGSSQIQIKESNSSAVAPATVATDQVQLNDVQVDGTPAAQVTNLVQGAVDEGVNVADLASGAMAQSYATRLTQNMPTVLGNMTQVTSAVFGGLTGAMAQACDIAPAQVSGFSHAFEIEAADTEADDEEL